VEEAAPRHPREVMTPVIDLAQRDHYLRIRRRKEGVEILDVSPEDVARVPKARRRRKSLLPRKSLIVAWMTTG
jgi:hypothetical protein